MAFNLDSRLVVGATLAVTTGVAAYSTYKLWQLKQEREKENVYETEKLLNEYLLLHYGLPDELMLWDFGPKTATEFPKRCAELCIKYFDANKGAPRSALDVGCAVGRSSFELTRMFSKVVGVDYSNNFIRGCNDMKEKGHMTYTATTEGFLDQMLVARVDPSLDRQKCSFEVGDACVLSADLRQFGCVLAANLICRLPRPDMFLLRCTDLVAKGGILVITSPYTFLPEYTAKDNMIGGMIRNGRAITGFQGLNTLLGSHFELIGEEEMPFVIRETKRKHQWTVAHATIWRRK